MGRPFVRQRQAVPLDSAMATDQSLPRHDEYLSQGAVGTKSRTDEEEISKGVFVSSHDVCPPAESCDV